MVIMNKLCVCCGNRRESSDNVKNNILRFRFYIVTCIQNIFCGQNHYFNLKFEILFFFNLKYLVLLHVTTNLADNIFQ